MYASSDTQMSMGPAWALRCSKHRDHSICLSAPLRAHHPPCGPGTSLHCGNMRVTCMVCRGGHHYGEVCNSWRKQMSYCHASHMVTTARGQSVIVYFQYGSSAEARGLRISRRHRGSAAPVLLPLTCLSEASGYPSCKPRFPEVEIKAAGYPPQSMH